MPARAGGRDAGRHEGLCRRLLLGNAVDVAVGLGQLKRGQLNDVATWKEARDDATRLFVVCGRDADAGSLRSSSSA